jgi:hypothetical protein
MSASARVIRRLPFRAARFVPYPPTLLSLIAYLCWLAGIAGPFKRKRKQVGAVGIEIASPSN